MKIKDRTVLITGASQGIGKSTAINLSKQGANIIINFNSNEKLANEVLKECNKYSQKNIVVKADITNELEVKEMFNTIKKKYSKLDVLINNAGIYDESDSFTNLKAFENIFHKNFLSHINVIKNALEIMTNGKIINVTSVHGEFGHGRSDVAAYSSLKAAFNHYTKNLAKELAPKILVNGIAPGKTMTSMWGNLKKDEEKELSATQLINRFILPEEIADGIFFLIAIASFRFFKVKEFSLAPAVP